MMVKTTVGRISREYATLEEAKADMGEMLMPGKDLQITGEDGTSLYSLEWFPLERTRENLPRLIDCAAKRTAVLAAENNGLWLPATAEGGTSHEAE